MIRLKQSLRFLGFAAGISLALLSSACYTRLGHGDPYTRGYDDGYRSDHWTEAYYVYVPFDPWGPFPGARWWYADYHSCWYHPPVSGYDDWDDVSGRHGWDRGPGAPSSPSTPRVGVGSGGSGGGGGTPGTTGDPQTVESKNPAREGGQAPSREAEKKPKEEPKENRRAWGR